MTTNKEKQVIQLTNAGANPGVIALSTGMSESRVKQVQQKLRKDGLLPPEGRR